MFVPPMIKPYVADLSSNEMVIDIGLTASVFVLSTIVLKIMTSGLRRSISFLVPAAIDYPLGVIFALTKSFLLFGLLFSVATNVYSAVLKQSSVQVMANLPSWFTQAKSANMIKMSGQMLDPFVSQFLAKNFGKITNSIDQDSLNEKIKNISGETGIDIPEVDLDKLDTENMDFENLDPEKAKEKMEDFGYDEKNLEKLNRLIEIIGK